MCAYVCVRFGGGGRGGRVSTLYVGRMWGLHWLCVCSLCWHSVFWCLLAVHSVVKKVAQYMADVLEDSRDKVQENLLANGGTLMVTTDYFNTRNLVIIKWDTAKAITYHGFLPMKNVTLGILMLFYFLLFYPKSTNIMINNYVSTRSSKWQKNIFSYGSLVISNHAVLFLFEIFISVISASTPM